MMRIVGLRKKSTQILLKEIPSGTIFTGELWYDKSQMTPELTFLKTTSCLVDLMTPDVRHQYTVLYTVLTVRNYQPRPNAVLNLEG